MVALMLVWAVHDGGYDADTWYWGALVALGLLAATVTAGPPASLGPARTVALAAFAAYVAWSYASIGWAQSQGDALQSANQSLLYFLVFAELLILPWTAEAALTALGVWALGVGVIAIVLLFRLASGDQVANLVEGGRLAAPTGYFNATAALFTMGALLNVVLATRRELPGLLRGLLLALACGELQLAVTVQSRGWLFTLPLIAVLALWVSADRLRVVAAAIIPLVGTAAILHRLLAVFQAANPGSLDQVAARAGQAALLICAGCFVLGTLLAWADALRRGRELSPGLRRLIGGTLLAVAVIGVIAGGTIATHGRPFRFISREWNGFSHAQTRFSTQSHFGDVGSGRYDYWRVALDAFTAHPLGGIGGGNFGDYYLIHRRTTEEPSSVHSLELRVLAETGILGVVLLGVAFLAALAAGVAARRSAGAAGLDPPTRRSNLRPAVAGAALLPLIVWAVHGSIDWFWEMPALSGPALGFLGVAGALSARPAAQPSMAAVRSGGRSASGLRRGAAVAAGVLGVLAAAFVLGLPYLSVREVSMGSDAAAHDPAGSLRDFATAADLNPLSSVPGRLAGVVALNTQQYEIAAARFRQSIQREPGGWFSWLGAGLAASAMGHRTEAAHDFRTAYAIDNSQPANAAALKRVYSRHPLTPREAFRLLIVQ